MSEPSPMPVPEAQEAPEALDPNFRIELPNFEGPLDLLLHLIRKHELDILDLPISFITDKYLEYLGLMGDLNLDVASEYLVMAATLAHIKSKMLLPRPPEDQDEDEIDGLDPRAELIRRLLEYQKYKIGCSRSGRARDRRAETCSRGAPLRRPPMGPPPLAQVSVFKLLDALKKIAERINASISLEVDAEQMTIQERIGGLWSICFGIAAGAGSTSSSKASAPRTISWSRFWRCSRWQRCGWRASIRPITRNRSTSSTRCSMRRGCLSCRPTCRHRRATSWKTEIDLTEPVELGEERRESVVVPAGTSGAYAWKEDE